MKRLLLLLAFAPVAALSAVPEVLIVQVNMPKSRQSDPNVGILPYVAQEFDDDGRVVPIAWSLADPIFRAAVDDKLIRYDENPTMDTLVATAKKMKFEYIMLIQAWHKDGFVRTRTRLLSGEKSIWMDPVPDEKLIASQQQSHKDAVEYARKNGMEPPKPVDVEDLDSRGIQITMGSSFDLDSFGKSMARTWASQLYAGPWKNLPNRPRMVQPVVNQTVETQPAIAPDIPNPPPVRKVDNKDLMEEVMKLLTSGKGLQAVQTLRDAVDAEPLDLERRRALVNALMHTGQPQLAAMEARRAAELMPDKSEFRALAARAWLQLGKTEEAEKDLNEAIAKDPESADTRALMGEMNLLKGKSEAAIEHFDYAISKAPTADMHFRRALAKALNNDAAGCQLDLQESQKLGLASDPFSIRTRYSNAAGLTDAVIDETAKNVRSLLQQARLKPKQAEVAAEQRELAGRSAALAALYEGLSVPELHKPSHERRVLALKLLLQSLTEIGSYLNEQDEEVIGDATINLGEALKQVRDAQEVYKAELEKG